MKRSMLCAWAALFLLTAGQSAAQRLPCPRECECFLVNQAVFHADCAGMELTQLPYGIDEQTQILDLSNNLFATIPAEISSIKYLEQLNLSGNQIKALSQDSLLNLTSLVVLDLSKNLISKWEDINPNSILLPAISLDTLILSKNPLNVFANLKNTEMLISPNLYRLDLNNCGIVTIHGKSPIAGLSELRHLSLSHNPLRRFQKIVSPTLRYLDISHCELSFVNLEELNFLPSLTHLVMSHNYRLSFNKLDHPTSLSLRTINLSYCNMNRVSLSGFPNLETADLRGNMIRFLLQGEFMNNSQLISLDMSSNAIDSINKNAFDGLVSLKLLNLSINVIPSLHEETFMRTTNLSKLIVSRNYLYTVSPLKSSSLKTIDMSSCEIQSIDANAFVHLPALTDINLSRNLINTIPDFLSSNSLQSLDLSYNRLSVMNNETLSGLPGLKKIKLSENRFTEMWKVSYFAENKELEEVSIEDNMWRCQCDNDMKMLYEFFTTNPPKVWNINFNMLCQSPPELSGKNWIEACYFEWNPRAPFTSNQRVVTGFLIAFFSFFVAWLLFTFIRRAMRKKIEAEAQERARQAEEARDRLREMRMRREQQLALHTNAPDPRDLVSPPSYDEALLMPRLDGSFHSLSGVGLSQEKKQKKKARRRTRSIGDLNSDVESVQKSRRRRKSHSEENIHTPDEENSHPLSQHTHQLSQQSEEVPEVIIVHRLHESDL